MSTVLVTGASGVIGSRLTPMLSREHEVVALSRREVDGVQHAVRGDFASVEDLRALDRHEFDTAIHLAAAIDECPESEYLAVNVLGTATLLRYLVERGCRHVILASSIAATGCLSETFVPEELPIGDDHPANTADAYGMSKGLMEELALYFHRQTPELEIALMRIGGVIEWGAAYYEQHVIADTEVPFGLGGVIAGDDVAAALTVATERRLGPGVRRFNLVGPSSWTTEPVPDALRAALGDLVTGLDMSFYEVEGRERASLFTTDRFWEQYGFRPLTDVRPKNLTGGNR